MRNGNLQKVWIHLFLTSLRSYPTYEEWKQEKEIIEEETIYVLILPMRNGNDQVLKIPVFLPRFSSYPTYEEWKLPMLNSHKKSWKRSYPTYEEWKHITFTNAEAWLKEFLSYL